MARIVVGYLGPDLLLVAIKEQMKLPTPDCKEKPKRRALEAANKKKHWPLTQVHKNPHNGHGHECGMHLRVPTNHLRMVLQSENGIWIPRLVLATFGLGVGGLGLVVGLRVRG